MKTMKTKNALLEFVTNWTQGSARAITQQDRKMLGDLKTCLDPFPDDLGEQLGVPRGSSFGGAVRYICEVLEEAGLGDSACLIPPIPGFPPIPAIPPMRP